MARAAAPVTACRTCGTRLRCFQCYSQRLPQCILQGLLVYEFLAGGSLDQRLFASAAAAAGRPPLAWKDRVRVAAEVASALLFLHTAPTPIVHMDLKPQVRG